MDARNFLRAKLPLLALTCLLAGIAMSAPAPERNEEIVKDRASFLPTRIAPQPGKVVGLLVNDPGAVMRRNGRQGEPGQLAFCTGDNNYDWMHVSGVAKPVYPERRIRTGEKGDSAKVYTNIGLATAETVNERFGFSAHYALVEVEINDGLGSPGDQWMIATQMKRVDDTKEYPLKVPEVVEQLRKTYDAWLKDQALALEEQLAQAQKKSLKDAKPSGPRETTTIMYLTWLPSTQRLCARFLTRISDVSFEDDGQGSASASGVKPAKFRHGTQSGIEFGMGYEVSRNGNLERTLKLPAESFEHKILAPPRASK